MKGTTTGQDIFQSLKSCIEQHGLTWNRLVCLAIDGTLAMCSSNVGIVRLMKNKLNSDESDVISFFSVYCILHQEPHCNKSLKMKEVMNLALKTVNNI